MMTRKYQNQGQKKSQQDKVFSSKYHEIIAWMILLLVIVGSVVGAFGYKYGKKFAFMDIYKYSELCKDDYSVLDMYYESGMLRLRCDPVYDFDVESEPEPVESGSFDVIVEVVN